MFLPAGLRSRFDSDRTLGSWLSGDEFEESTAAATPALKAGGICTLSVQDKEGDMSYLLITPGSSVSFHSWVAPIFGGLSKGSQVA